MENISKAVLSDPSDEVLIQQYKEGSMDAFNALYHRYLPNVYKRVRYVIPTNDVEDVTQEIFIAMLNSLPSFRGAAQLSTWLRTLTNHKVAEFYRKRNRKQDPPTVPLSEASDRNDGNEAKKLEEIILIQRALQKLPENHREIILLRLAEDLQFNEIAEITGQNLEAIKSLFRRAMIALRKLLDE